MTPVQGTVVHWLDAHAGAVTALATVVLCVVTAVYVAVTYLLVREQRRQFLQPQIVRELTHATATEGGTLLVRNLGPGVAIDVALHAGPEHDLPVGVVIDHLGVGFDLAAGDERTWSIQWPAEVPTCDLWLTITSLDRPRTMLSVDAFVLRLSPAGVGASAGWSGEIDAAHLKRMARRNVKPKDRWKFRIRHRKSALYQLLVDEQARSALSASIARELTGALDWEKDLRRTFGRI